MTAWENMLLAAVLLTGFAAVGSSRLATGIRALGAQGVLVGVLPLVHSVAGWNPRMVGFGAVVATTKGVLFPWLLSRAIRASQTRRETEPVVGYGASLALAAVLLPAAFWLADRAPLAVSQAGALMAPTAFTLMGMGLFLMVARRTAVSQVLGYLMLENGIHTFGLTVFTHLPLLVELGVLMDAFVAVFAMGIAIDHINREFDHMDTTRLTSLKG